MKYKINCDEELELKKKKYQSFNPFVNNTNKFSKYKKEVGQKLYIIY